MPIAVTALLFVAFVLAVALILKLSSLEKYKQLKTIHREKKIGSAISAGALAWAAFQGYEILGQDFPMISSLIPIVAPLLIVGVYFLMDFILTRAIGGIAVMLICELFYQSQEVPMSGRFVFSIIGYAFAIAGMYMIGQPWRFRDILFKSSEDKQYGTKAFYVISGSLALMFVPFVVAYV